MIVLGIADNHDSGAAVVIDGALVSAVNQERIDRIKMSGAFPWGAIDSALDVAGVKASDVDRIVVGTGFTPSTALRAMPDMHHNARDQGQFSPLLHAYIVYQSTLRATGLHMVEIDASRALLARRMAERRLGHATIQMMDHHTSHAQGAYRTQPHDHSLVLTVDAMGDGTTATASLGQAGQLDQLWRQSGLAAINTFYSRITELLGFRPVRHEGKITGLAAFVPPPPALLAHMRTRLHFKDGRFSRVSRTRPDRKNDAFWGEIARYNREEVSASAQRVVEEAVTAFVSHWVAHTGCAHVAVAGGIFANVKLNQRIAELPEVESLWVMPNMGDGGLAAGAAMASAGTAPHRMVHAYLGPAYSDRDCYKALDRGGLPKQNLAETTTPEGVRGDIDAIARVIADRGVVARFDGGMEWGPRALCNRSILARPDDPSVNDWLNEKLSRSEFMPFAPVARIEDAGRWFKGVRKAPLAARFMTVCFEVTPEFSERCAAAVHVDGTARPQLISAEENPSVHALLGRVGELTGTPVLINTSFNLHEEPIVCSPSDAVRAFTQAQLDALWLGPYVARREPSS